MGTSGRRNLIRDLQADISRDLVLERWSRGMHPVPALFPHVHDGCDRCCDFYEALRYKKVLRMEDEVKIVIAKISKEARVELLRSNLGISQVFCSGSRWFCSQSIRIASTN